MPKMKCRTCSGSGKVMGGGMMQWDCEVCDGYGKIEVQDEQKDIDYLLEKTSERYQNAKKEIKGLGKEISDEKAEELLDAELSKQGVKVERKLEVVNDGKKRK